MSLTTLLKVLTAKAARTIAMKILMGVLRCPVMFRSPLRMRKKNTGMACGMAHRRTTMLKVTTEIVYWRRETKRVHPLRTVQNVTYMAVKQSFLLLLLPRFLSGTAEDGTFLDVHVTCVFLQTKCMLLPKSTCIAYC